MITNNTELYSIVGFFIDKFKRDNETMEQCPFEFAFHKYVTR